jgi:hypothetical protein
MLNQWRMMYWSDYLDFKEVFVYIIQRISRPECDVILQWISMVEHLPCYSAPAVGWVSYLPVDQLAGRRLTHFAICEIPSIQSRQKACWVIISV